MKRCQTGDHFASYDLGTLTLTSLRDGYVDMPPTRLRQPGNTPFADGLPDKGRCTTASCGFRSTPSRSTMAETSR